jgi:hypothetical protein
MRMIAVMFLLAALGARSADAKGSFVLTRTPNTSQTKGFADGQTLCPIASFTLTNVGDAPGTLQAFGAGGPQNLSAFEVCVGGKGYGTQTAPLTTGDLNISVGCLATVNLVVAPASAVEIVVRATVSSTGHSAWVAGLYVETDVSSTVKVNDIVYNYVSDLIPTAATANCSLRATVTPSSVAIMGFVVTGDSGLRYPYLIHVVGPSLASFQITDFLPDPNLTVYDARGTVIGQNDDWSGLDAAFTAVGAFGLPKGSRDAGIIMWLAPGNYTVIARGTSTAGTGTVLLEQYRLPAEPVVP